MLIDVVFVAVKTPLCVLYKHFMNCRNNTAFRTVGRDELPVEAMLGLILNLCKHVVRKKETKQNKTNLTF